MLDLLNQWLAPFASLNYFVYPLIAVMGLVVGSFLNVVILRTPKMMEQAFRSECCDLLEIDTEKPAPISLSQPNSRCPECHAPIRPWQNIPVMSYLLLKGQCANCGARISARYPIIEAVTGLLSVLVIALMGFNSAGVFGLLLLWLLIVLTMIDIDTYLLPDHLTLPLMWLGLLLNTQGLYTDLHSAVWGAVGGYMSLWSVYWLFKLVTGKEGMGFGDFKLLAALGAWMGWQFLPLIIVLSSFVGALIGIAGILILGRDKNIPIPFGPYLAIAGLIAFLWGETLIAGYFQFLGV